MPSWPKTSSRTCANRRGPHLIAPFERPFHTNARALVESGMAGP
jgi:hypothetical protein